MTINNKRILTCFIAALMALSAVSCSEKSDNTQPQSSENSPASSDVLSSESETRYLDDIGDDVKFNGEKIRFIMSSGDRIYVDPEEHDIADPVNEAIWRRNNLVTERINVSVTEPVKTDNNNTIIRQVLNSVTAGSDDYDVPVGHARFSIALLLENVLYKLDNLAYIDLDKDYWSQGVNDNMSLHGDHFWAIGDLSVAHYSTTYIMMANAEIWNNNYPDENLYEIVREGKWTIDALRNYSSNVYRDLNGNGQRDKEDLYGYATNERHELTGFFFAAGINYSDFDSDGIPYITLNSEHTINVFNKVHELLYDEESVYNEGPIDSSYFEDMYLTNRAMFATGLFSTLENEQVRNMEEDFYVIPMPKYDEEQEYRTSQQDGVSIFGILNTVDEERADIVAATLELMSSLGNQYVIPVYYDDVLKNKYSRDPETAEMIDLIRNSLETDFALKWSDSMPMVSIFSFLSNNIKKDSISSVLEKSQRIWEKDLASIVERLEEIAEQYE